MFIGRHCLGRDAHHLQTTAQPALMQKGHPDFTLFWVTKVGFTVAILIPPGFIMKLVCKEKTIPCIIHKRDCYCARRFTSQWDSSLQCVTITKRQKAQPPVGYQLLLTGFFVLCLHLRTNARSLTRWKSFSFPNTQQQRARSKWEPSRQYKGLGTKECRKVTAQLTKHSSTNLKLISAYSTVRCH